MQTKLKKLKLAIYFFLRNAMHPIGTAYILWFCASEIDFVNELNVYEMIPVSAIGGFAMGCLLGGTYEILRLAFFGDPIDSQDVYRSGYGGIAGMLIVWIYPRVEQWIGQYIPTWFADAVYYTIIAAFVSDLVYAIYNQNKVKINAFFIKLKSYFVR